MIPVFVRGEDISCLRPRAHFDRLLQRSGEDITKAYAANDTTFFEFSTSIPLAYVNKFVLRGNRIEYGENHFRETRVIR
jgi:hypothetical protein